jgi:predicted permease
LRLFVAANPLGALPPYALTINWRMLLMAVGAGGVITAFAGLVPAARTSRCDLSTLVGTGDARSTGAANPRVQLALLGIQTAISLVLAATTVLLARTFSELQNTPLGFDAANLVVVDVALPADQFDSASKREAAFAAMAERLAALPGVQQIAASTSPPLSSGSATSVRADVHDGDVPLRISAQDVTPLFFQTSGIPLTAGRVFDERDRRTSAPVVVINQSAARALFDRVDVVGRHLRVATEPPREVVGVVGNTQSTFYNTLEWRTNPVIFLPASQAFDAIRDPSVRSFGLHLLLRTSRTVSMADVKPLVTAVDANIAVSTVGTTLDQVADATKQPHFRMTLLAWFGAASVLLAAIGVYGVVAQVVVARRREFGVRLALGAATTRLVRSLVSRMVMLGMVSIACGGVLLIALRQTVRAMLYGVQPLDTPSIALAMGLLLVVLTVAALIPALRLTARDPLDALRE